MDVVMEEESCLLNRDVIQFFLMLLFIVGVVMIVMKNDSQLVVKRYNTRCYRYDYTTYLKLSSNKDVYENEVIEEIIDVKPTFNDLLNTIRNLYLISYPCIMKSYTSFSFSDKRSLVPLIIGNRLFLNNGET